MAEVWWCSMAITYSTDTPSHRVWSQWVHHLFFNRIDPKYTSVGVFHREGVSWSIASDDLVSTITQSKPNWHGVGLDRRVKEYQLKKCSACGNSFKTVGNLFHFYIVVFRFLWSLKRDITNSSGSLEIHGQPIKSGKWVELTSTKTISFHANEVIVIQKKKENHI